MKIYDITKTIEINQNDIDYTRYKLVKDTKVIHHEAIAEVKEVSHYEVVKFYENGGKDLVKIIDVEGVKGQDAYDETIDIQVLTPLTAEEINKNNEHKYSELVEKFIREKYSISDELALLRQRDSKQVEFKEYYDYVESCKSKAKGMI